MCLENSVLNSIYFNCLATSSSFPYPSRIVNSQNIVFPDSAIADHQNMQHQSEHLGLHGDNHTCVFYDY